MRFKSTALWGDRLKWRIEALGGASEVMGDASRRGIGT
jgi:hypothetical protein